VRQTPVAILAAGRGRGPALACNGFILRKAPRQIKSASATPCDGASARSTSAPKLRVLGWPFGGGIGRAVALAFAAGARVAVHDNTSADDAKQTLAAIEKRGSSGALVQADLSDEAAASAAVDRAAEHLGGIDVLINNAGDPLSRSALADCPTTFGGGRSR